jgi:hypothetical protein
MPSGYRVLAGGLVLAVLAGDHGIAQPDEPDCRIVEFEVTPSPDLQMVAWLEDTDGNYVDTIFITRKTGTYGLGNRPGMMQFNSGPRWPYGRRTTTFPVWAARHGFSFPLVVFQDGMDDNLSHALGESSRERFYCRPIMPDEELWDAQSCASTVYTDKGLLSSDGTSPYPPRSDVTFDPGKDHASVDGMAELNPFDAVSQATPVGDQVFSTNWLAPFDLPNGDYVLWLEVSSEFDQNEVYDYPEPEGIPWSEYGVAYRGQPSLVYSTPFSLTTELTTARTLDYVGYGDPDGEDGEIRPPDETITEGMPGSGASRLAVMLEGSDPYRLKVSAYPSPDEAMPDAPGPVEVTEVTGSSARARFTAPGDDGLEGKVTGYEIRYLPGGEVDASNFYDAIEAVVVMDEVEPGEVQELEILELVPRTSYTVAVRAYDECRNVGPITTFEVVTPRPEPGTVDACFIATAAYGSPMAGEVSSLRAFRDAALRSHIAGEIAVESYYTFGPLLARVIAPSETLRRAARAALAPVTARVKGAGF